LLASSRQADRWIQAAVDYKTKSKLKGREGSIIYNTDDSKFFAYFMGHRIVSLTVVSSAGGIDFGRETRR
jgi:hypothetical protein